MCVCVVMRGGLHGRFPSGRFNEQSSQTARTRTRRCTVCSANLADASPSITADA